MFRKRFSDRSSGKHRIDAQPVIPLLICVAVLLPFLILVGYAMGQQSQYREFVYALSESTVYCYEHHSLRADLEEDSVRVSGENAYDVYFLFTKKRAKPRLTTPDTEPDLTLDYGDGAVLECWRIKMDQKARRSYGIFWRFTSAQGDIWMYDTDDLDLSKLQRVVALDKNEPW